MDAKYQENAGRVLPRERVGESNTLFWEFEGLRNVADVMNTVTFSQ